MHSTSLFNHLPTPCFSTDEKGEILVCNASFNKLFETTTAVGKQIQAYLSVASKIFYQSFIYPTLLHEHAVKEMYCTFTSATHKSIPVLVNAEMVVENGKKQFLWVLFVVKEREKFEKELLHYKNNLEEKAHDLAEILRSKELISQQLSAELLLKNRFFTIISHDLRSPINALVGLTELLNESMEVGSEQEIKKLVPFILQSSKSLSDLFTNLLEWSKVQTNADEIIAEEINLRDVAERTIATVSSMAAKKNIQIQNEVRNNFAIGDKNMVNLIFRNIITNAVKFSPINGQIRLYSKVKKNQVYVYVQDEGAGIKEELIRTVFRADIKTTTVGTQNELGTGIGLPLCKQMIELNKGKIGCKNNPDKGATFYFSLPLATFNA